MFQHVDDGLVGGQQQIVAPRPGQSRQGRGLGDPVSQRGEVGADRPVHSLVGIHARPLMGMPFLDLTGGHRRAYQNQDGY
ncbi:hypothetical protein ACFQX6_05065 [Streptosporangium lutulentum]